MQTLAELFNQRASRVGPSDSGDAQPRALSERAPAPGDVVVVKIGDPLANLVGVIR